MIDDDINFTLFCNLIKNLFNKYIKINYISYIKSVKNSLFFIYIYNKQTIN